MKSMIKNTLNKLPFKKRYIVGGYIAFEVIGLTVAGTAGAQVLDQIKFEVPQRVASATLPTEPGLTRLIVSSNAGFTVSASEAIGEYDVKVLRDGLINTTPFGLNAQLPGPETACSAAVSPAASVIYRADRKTAAARGGVLTQSVMIEIRYDETLRPKFSVKTEDNSVAITPAAACEGRLG